MEWSGVLPPVCVERGEGRGDLSSVSTLSQGHPGGASEGSEGGDGGDGGGGECLSQC